MTTWLTVCVYAPHLMIDLARQWIPTTRPLAIAANNSDRAPVIDCDEHAVVAGVQIGMPVLTARRLCRNLDVRIPDRSANAYTADQIATLLATQTDDIRRVGAHLWTSHAVALGHAYRAAPRLAKDLQTAITKQTGVVCQVGLARTTVVAGIAARIARMTSIVLPDTEPAFLSPLPVGLLPGVGAKTVEVLRGLGITTIGQLQMVSAPALTQICGHRGRTIARLALGQDATSASRDTPTITARWVSEEPEGDGRRLHAHVHTQTAEAGRELRGRDQSAGELSLRVTWADGGDSQHSERDAARRNLDGGLGALSRRALDALLHQRRLAVRALTVTLDDLGGRQIDLFAAADDRPHQLQHALDRLALRYGPQAVLPGSLIGVLPALR